MCEFDEYFMTLICGGSYVDVNSVCFFCIADSIERIFRRYTLLGKCLFLIKSGARPPRMPVSWSEAPPSKPIYGQPVLSMQFYLCAESIVKMEILPEDFY